ncbi:hypothetical protein MKL26_03540 [Streptococcus suis]|nr:hypothetical protein [Streptococcus suis]
MKKIVLAILGAILFIGIAVVGFGVFIESRSIDGVWQTKDVKNEMITSLSKEDIAGIGELGLTPDQLIKDMYMTLDVSEGNAKVNISCHVDVEVFKTSLIKLIDDTLKSELEKEGLLYDDLSIEDKQRIDASKSDSIIEQQITDSFTMSAQEMGGEYDSKTGALTVKILEGTVDPVFNSIKVTSINEKASQFLGMGIESGDFSKYTRNGNTLVIDNEQQLTFLKK